MRRAGFGRPWAGWLTALALAAAPGGAFARDGVSYLPTPAGFAALAVPEAAGAPFPVVLILPDALGPDRPGRAYADALNAQGVATIELLPAVSDDRRGAPPEPPVTGPSGVLAALRADPRVDASRLGVLAFGAGGLTALRDPVLAAAPAVLLHPGCARLPPPPADRPLLVLHGGGADRADAPGACARWAATGGRFVRRHEYARATHGWDHSDTPWAGGLALLPSAGAAGGGPRRPGHHGGRRRAGRGVPGGGTGLRGRGGAVRRPGHHRGAAAGAGWMKP